MGSSHSTNEAPSIESVLEKPMQKASMLNSNTSKFVDFANDLVASLGFVMNPKTGKWEQQSVARVHGGIATVYTTLRIGHEIRSGKFKLFQGNQD